jgi:hypothetical protein
VRIICGWRDCFCCVYVRAGAVLFVLEFDGVLLLQEATGNAEGGVDIPTTCDSVIFQFTPSGFTGPATLSSVDELG